MNEVLDIIKKNNVSYEFLFDSIFKYRDIDSIELNKILEDLISMELIYLDEMGKYCYVGKSNLVSTLEQNSHGIYFIRNGNEKITISNNDLCGALKYDRVVVEFLNHNACKVVGITKRQNKNLVCEVVVKNNKLALIPFNGNKHISLVVDSDLLKDFIVGDRVLVKLDCKACQFNDIVVKNVSKLGHFNDRFNDEISVAISKGFDIDFSSESMNEANNMPNEIRTCDRVNRVDLTNENIFTIDSVHTKDMDDAVSIKKLDNGNYLLSVHIADVSFYVKRGSSLYKEALKRGTSVYLGECVIPMIPSILSNGICSLNEGVDRLTKTCSIEIDKYGRIVDYKVFNSVINSKKKMSYEELNDMFKGKEFDDSYLPFIIDIELMRKLSNILSKSRNNKGYLDFDSSEIEVNEDTFENKILGFSKREQGEAENIIENFMIYANVCIASYFHYTELPFIYRVHNNPDQLKLDDTIELIHNIGSKITRINNAYNQKALQGILEQYKGTKEYSIISNLLLRNMCKAKYSTENIGHYALVEDAYCHFTSPIRRIPDLVVHMLINQFIVDGNFSVDFNKLNDILTEVANHASYKERQSDDAERDYVKLKMAEYMSDHIGEEFDGMFVDIDNEKVVVKLDNDVRGLVDWNGDFLNAFRVDSSTKTLVSNFSKQRVKLATRVRIKVTSVNIPQKEIYFDVVKILGKSKTLELKKDDIDE